MSESLRREIPALTKAMLAAREGRSSYSLSQTGAADALRSVARTAEDLTEEAAQRALTAAQITRSTITEAADKTERNARRGARQARKVPGVARAEGEIKGALASAEDLAMDDYEQLNVGEIVEQLPTLSQIELAKINAHERKNKNRDSVLSKIATLQRNEPWPGYDELTVEEIQAVIAQSDDETLKRNTREYEHAHKDRAGVLRAIEPPSQQTAGGV
jgi:hypothetical protein